MNELYDELRKIERSLEFFRYHSSYKENYFANRVNIYILNVMKFMQKGS